MISDNEKEGELNNKFINVVDENNLLNKKKIILKKEELIKKVKNKN